MNVTLRMLETNAVSELSVSTVAAEAGVAETTIYRRWGSLPGLISAALSEFALSENPIPDTGTLEGDLTQLLQNVAAIFERPSIRRVLRFTMALDAADAVDARTRFWRTRFAAGATVVDRAVCRGEILPLADPVEVIENLVGAVYVRRFLLERPITDTFIDQSVRAALHIVQPVISSASKLASDTEN